MRRFRCLGRCLREQLLGLDDVGARLPEAREGQVAATWLGTAGIHVSDGRNAFLVDPFVSRPARLPVLLGRPLSPHLDAIRQCLATFATPPDAVLVSHSHFDHCMDAPLFARESQAILVGSESTLQAGRGAGLPPERLHRAVPRESLRFGDFEVTLLPSRHQRLGLRAAPGRPVGPTPSRRSAVGVPFPGSIRAPLLPPAPASAWRVGEVFAFQVRHPQGSFAFLGSAAWAWETFSPTAGTSTFKVDLVVLALAGRKDDKGTIAALMKATGARRFVPIHHDDFFVPLRNRPRPFPGLDYGAFIDAARSLEVEVRTLGIGRPLALFG